MTVRRHRHPLLFAGPLNHLVKFGLRGPRDRSPLVDEQDEGVGQVNVTDILHALRTGVHLADLISPVVNVAETAWVEDVLTCLTADGQSRLGVL